MLSNRQGQEKKYLLALLIIYIIWHVIGRIGLSIDLQWHVDVGRDQMFTPPHVMILAGLFPAMIVSALFLIWTTRDYHRGIAVSGLKIGPFVAPIVIWMTFMGQLTIMFGGVFDDYWHAQYGLDVNILTPPHFWTISGGMVAELGTIILACQLLKMSNQQQENENKFVLTLALLSIWALLIHLYFSAGNFLDSRQVIFELAGLEVLPHLAVAGFVTILIIEMTTHLLGAKALIKLAQITLASQILLLFFIPLIVEVLMSEQHVYRPGSPHQVFISNFMPWLLLPVLLCFKKWPILKQNKLSYIVIILAIDPIWLPLYGQYLPSLAGVGGVILSIIISIPILYLAIFSSGKLATIFDNLMLRTMNEKRLQSQSITETQNQIQIVGQNQGDKHSRSITETQNQITTETQNQIQNGTGTKNATEAQMIQENNKGTKSALGASIVVILMLGLLLLPVAQGHDPIHKTEQGDGFDAPMRMLFDLEGDEFWVEFMIYPPKALGSTEMLIYPVDESTNVSNIWIENVFFDEKGEARMLTQFEKLPNGGVWVGSVTFPFSGNNTVEFWATVNGNSSFISIDVNIESATTFSLELAWALGLGWPFTMAIILWQVSRKNAENYGEQQ